jgi:hypothetical protein
MTRLSRRSTLHITVAGVLTALSLQGCGASDAVLPDQHQSPTLVSAAHVLTPQSTGSSNPEAKAKISASKGGKLNCGRFELVLAPGALLKDTEIRIVDVTNSVGHVECHLYPDGLVFLNTVTLEADFSDLTSPSGYTMYWRLPTPTGEIWTDVGGRPTDDGRGIIARLEHFSDYAPGKAGW